MRTIQRTDFHFPGQTRVYHGKVRDVYELGPYLISIATDRISAFDVILPRCIPGKGQVLNQVAAYFLEHTRDLVPNWLLAVPDPNVSIGLRCQPVRLEMVVRGYLAGHAWRTYKSGKRNLCGVSLPDGLSENDRLPEPIITPSTKAEVGHDEDISAAEILDREIVSEERWNELCRASLALFARGTEMAAAKGLILVDTKYEFGLFEDKLYVIDEVHTPDSSRYFYAAGYAERQEKGLPQKQLSKEFVREWLMENGFSGQEGQQVPDMTDAVVDSISGRYIELYEQVTGQAFRPAPEGDPLKRIENSILDFLARS